MKIKSLSEFHEQAPRNATHVLKMGDKYKYANFNHGEYDSCDNATRDEMLINPMAGNDDTFFVISDDFWAVHIELTPYR